MAVTSVSVAAGFQSDLYKLLEQFTAAEIRMKDFTRIWRKMKFLKVYMYREELEMALFTEECFRIVLRVVMGQRPLPFKVGALFCLYSLYIMQPSEPKLKIRIVPETWKGLLGILEESQLEPWENEVKFVFWTLAYRSAFFFTFKPSSMGLVTNQCGDEVSADYTISSSLADYMNNEHKLLHDLHSRYINMKESLDPSAGKTVRLVQKDLFTSIEKDWKELQKKYNTDSVSAHQKDTSQSDEYSTEESENEDDPDDEDTLERRRNVRQKHQTIVAKPTKSRRHRTTEVHENVLKGKASPRRGRGSPKRGRGSSRGRGSKAKGKARSSPEHTERHFQEVDLPTDVQN